MSNKFFNFLKIILFLCLLILILKSKIFEITEKSFDLVVQKNKTFKEIKIGEFIQKISIENKTEIAISYSTDNQYIYPTIVSITSLILNADKNTFYNIYILHSPDFTDNNKKILNTVQFKYKDNCNIIYINMRNKYKNLPINEKLSITTYYRLYLQDILQNIDKIIYLDGDTLILGDLKELIDLDMKDNVIMGFIDDYADSIKSFRLINSTVICNGVLLIDLRGLRKYNYSKKIGYFIYKNRNRLIQHDQTIVNVVMQDKLGPIPPRYGVWNFLNESYIKKYLNIKRSGKRYNQKELLKAIEHPIIIHYALGKPFLTNETSFYREWWDVARASGYYDEISSQFKIN